MATPTKYPETDLIEPSEARDLFNYCAILVVEGLPTGSGFGIDLCEFCVGEKFKGVKLIPPGLHFVFASPVCKEDRKQSVGPRSGFYHDFQTKELLVMRWSNKNEEFDAEFVPTNEQLERYKSNLYDLDRYLGPYRYSTLRLYLGMSNRLTIDIAKQISKNKIICSELSFTKVDLKHNQALTSLREVESITQYYLDSTTKLDSAFKDRDGRERLLGEFQFAFITLIVLHIYECFEHWLDLLGLVCCADQGLRKYPEFFTEFIKILRDQLQQVSSDLFEDISDTTNRMRNHLDILFQNVDAIHNLNEDLKKIASDLKSSVELKFQWQFELEPDDERPILVELT